jgi:preprotein translocase subunit SecE
VAEQEDEDFDGLQAELATPGQESDIIPERAAAETPGDRAARQPARRERGAAAAQRGGGGVFDRAGSFWRDVRAELKRVTWPTLKEVQQTTIITIIAVIFFAAYLYGVDWSLARAIEGLTKLLGS